MDCTKAVIRKIEGVLEISFPSGEAGREDCCSAESGKENCAEIKVVCCPQENEEREEKKCCP